MFLNNTPLREKMAVLGFSVLLLFPASNSFAAKGSGENTTATAEVSRKPATDSIQDAMSDFKNLKKSEKRSRIREMNKAIRQYKADKKAGKEVSTNTLLLIILSILIPPLAVYLHEGEINSKFWISVLLTILGYLLFGFAGIFFLGSLPGIVYALIVVLEAA